jgi:OOP family OmpA-OmpF porin
MKHGVLAVLLGALAGGACAETADQAQGPYLGLGIGALHAKDIKAGELDPALQAQGLTVRTTSVEDRDTGWKLYAGYRLHRNWAVEGGYTSLGRYRDEGQVVENPGAVETTFKANSWNLAALAILPLDNGFEAFVKAGAGYWRTDLDSQGSFSGRSAHSAKANGTGALLGLGARWRFSDTLTARLEWERFSHVGKADSTGRTDIDFASIGLQYNF